MRSLDTRLQFQFQFQYNLNGEREKTHVCFFIVFFIV